MTDPDPTAIDAETRIRDVQQIQRRVALKQRDDDVRCVVLLAIDTTGNRSALALHRAEFDAQFPLRGREVLAAMRAGRTPAANGSLVL